MERKLTHLINKYMFEFKQNIKNKMTELNIEHTEHIKSLFQFIYDYDHLVITKEHLQKRKRTKNIAPLCYRCQARRACGNQCTRRRKAEHSLCGTHLKCTTHGIMGPQKPPTTRMVNVWAEDIKGIIYYIDNAHNVYDNQDILHNIPNPKIIAKWKQNDKQEYIITELL